MATTVDQHFITEYEAAVHLAYQQRGSKLRKTVRLATQVKASRHVFQKSGRGVAGKKARNGNVPIMNAQSGSVTVTLEDWYAAEYIDKLDALKTNVDELNVAAQTGAYALGRKMDELLIAKMAGAGSTVELGDAGLTKAKILAAFKALNAAEVPDDGQRFGVVGANQWNELLNIDEFKNSRFVGEAYPWLQGTESRTWLNIVWILSNHLPLSGSTRTCYLYHKSALGLAEGPGVFTSSIDWVPEKAAHLADNMMSAGAGLIDAEGVVAIDCNDDATIE
jgi:hypothetical protein